MQQKEKVQYGNYLTRVTSYFVPNASGNIEREKQEKELPPEAWSFLLFKDSLESLLNGTKILQAILNYVRILAALY